MLFTLSAGYLQQGLTQASAAHDTSTATFKSEPKSTRKATTASSETLQQFLKQGVPVRLNTKPEFKSMLAISQTRLW